MHATAFLSQPDRISTRPVIVLHGSEAHLKQAALRLILRATLGEGSDADASRYAGADVDFKSVRDELLTVSMFSSARVVVIEEADEFVSHYRSSLEEYWGRPARASVLVLDVKSWPKNTRLAKNLPDVGLEIECSELTGAALQRWLSDELQARGSKQLAREAGALLVELAGTSLGLLSQELDKLIAYVGERPKVTPEDVRAVVGGWRAETTWQMLDAVRDNRPAAALAALDKLLIAGEPGPKLLGGINYVFRRFAAATERARGGTPLRSALQQSGIRPADLEASQRYLQRIGRPRAEEILTLLATADSHLKGGSRLSDRLQLEGLLLNLAGALPAT